MLQMVWPITQILMRISWFNLLSLVHTSNISIRTQSIGGVHLTSWQSSWRNFYKRTINFYCIWEPTWLPYHCLLYPKGLVATRLYKNKHDTSSWRAKIKQEFLFVFVSFSSSLMLGKWLYAYDYDNPLFCLLFCPYAYAYGQVWTRLKHLNIFSFVLCCLFVIPLFSHWFLFLDVRYIGHCALYLYRFYRLNKMQM